MSMLHRRFMMRMEKTYREVYKPGEMMGRQTHSIDLGNVTTAPEESRGGAHILVLEQSAATVTFPREFDVSVLIPHWMNRLTNNLSSSWICMVIGV